MYNTKAQHSLYENAKKICKYSGIFGFEVSSFISRAAASLKITLPENVYVSASQNWLYRIVITGLNRIFTST